MRDNGRGGGRLRMQPPPFTMSRLDSRSLRILLLFVVLTGLPLAALAALGWQFLQQDRALELQRQRDQLNNAAALLVRDFASQLQTAEGALRDSAPISSATPGTGAF